MAKGKENTVSICERIALPIAEEMGLELWDVRFEKEGSGWFLRYFIDKEGKVGIDDCEAFSRKIDPILDKEDPIDKSYCLEVSSPGVERELKKPEHFQKYLGSKVTIRLIRAMDNKKEFVGELISYNDNVITVNIDGEEKSFDKKLCAFCRLYDDFI